MARASASAGRFNHALPTHERQKALQLHNLQNVRPIELVDDGSDIDRFSHQ